MSLGYGCVAQPLALKCYPDVSVDTYGLTPYAYDRFKAWSRGIEFAVNPGAMSYWKGAICSVFSVFRVIPALLLGVLVLNSRAVSISNPGFNLPMVNHPDFLHYNNGFHLPPADFGWTLVSGTIEHISDYWNGPSGFGDQSIDLNGNDPGLITQQVFLSPGTYELRFALSGNPDEGGVKIVRVWLGNSYVNFSFDTEGRDKSDMGWRFETARFRISTPGSYSLSFQSLTQGARGPAIDDVSINPAPVPEHLGSFGTFFVLAFFVGSVVLVRKSGSTGKLLRVSVAR